MSAQSLIIFLLGEEVLREHDGGLAHVEADSVVQAAAPVLNVYQHLQRAKDREGEGERGRGRDRD